MLLFDACYNEFILLNETICYVSVNKLYNYNLKIAYNLSLLRTNGRDFMNTLSVYYLQILLPLPVLAVIGITMCSMYFVGALFVYMLYRMVTDANKLINSGAVSGKDKWQMFTPFLSIKYFKQLYLM
jgi:hypothetical protein